ncbi:MAG: hypothetical protein ACO25L_03590 [Candidatus Nanopelagicales bacterium]
MSKHIFEEQGGPHRGHAAGKTDAEKQASQLASDVKYKVKQKMSGATKLNPAQVSKAYLSQLAKSPAPPAVKALAKKKILGEEHTDDIKELVEKSLVNALVQVFSEESVEKKEWIVVTDKKTGNTYRRQATRAKIAELRANPNVARVEITAYHPNEKDDVKGQKTAKVKSGKGLDAVGREDKDIDNDGDHDKSDKYLLNRRKVRGAAIAKKKGVSEEFLGEVENKTENQKKKITGEKVNNYSGKTAVVKVFPSLGEQIEDDKPAVGSQQKKSAGLDPNQKRQVSTLQQFQNKERQLNQQKLAAQKAGRIPVGSLQTSSYAPEGQIVDEAGDFWHPDPEKDRRISGAGNKMRSREDRGQDTSAQTKPDYSKRLKPGESYYEFAKRKSRGESVEYGEDIQEVAPPSAKAERMVKHIKKAYAKNGKLTKKEKGIAYATAWKHYNEEAECECDDEKKSKEKNGSVDPRSIPTEVNLTKNKLRAMGLKMSYEPEGEIIDERRKEDKVAGTPRKPRNPAFELVAKSMGTGRMGVKPRGEKKEPGKKPPAAGEYGGPKSPAQKVAARRASSQRAQDAMHSRFD